MRKHIFKNIYLIILLMLLIWTALYIASHDNNGHSDGFLNYGQVDISSGWKYDFHNGIEGETILPASLPKSDSKELTLTRVLPDIKQKTSFFYKVRHMPVRIKVDDIVKIDRITGRNFYDYGADLDGLYYVEVVLYPEDSGKTIEIYTKGNSKRYLSTPGKVLIGDRGSFFMSLINERWISLICMAVLGALAGFIWLIWLVIFVFLRRNTKVLLYLSLFCLMVTLWLLTQSEVYQFVVNDTGKMTVMAYEILIIMPMPIALFFYHYSERSAIKKISRIITTSVILLFFVENILNIYSMVHLTDTLIFSQIMLGVDILAIAIIQISEVGDRIRRRDESTPATWKIPLVGIACIVPLAGIEIAKFAVSAPSRPSDSIIITVGVFIYMFCLAVDCVSRVGTFNANEQDGIAKRGKRIFNLSSEVVLPVNAIMTFSDLIIEKSNEEELQNIALELPEAVNRLKSAINATYDNAFDFQDENRVLLEEYNVVSSVFKIDMLFEALVSKKGLNYSVDIDPNIPANLIGGEKHIIRALLILMNNAIKYTEHGKVSFAVQLIEPVNTETRRCLLRFAIKDNGKGLTADEINAIQELYKNVAKKGANTENVQEKDIILSRLLNALQSEIKIKSEIGKGTEIYFDLIQKYVGDDRVGNYEYIKGCLSSRTQTTLDFAADDVRILIADSDIITQDLIRAFISNAGITIDSVQDGESAMQKVLDNKYDLIFLNISLPKLDGIAAAKEIRMLAVKRKDMYFSTVPILLLTSNSMLRMNDKYLRAGVCDICHMPIESIGALNGILRLWLPAEKLQDITSDKRGDIVVLDDPRWERLPDCVNKELAKQNMPLFDMFVSASKTYVRKSAAGIAKLNEFRRRDDLENLLIGISILEKTATATALTKLCDKSEEIFTLYQDGKNEEVMTKASELTSYATYCMLQLEEFLEKI